VNGRIVAAFGRNFLVQTGDGGVVRCLARGKDAAYACGDRVHITATGADGAVIEAVDPRANLLLRSSQHRAKLLAANATQAAIVVAADPSFSDELVMRVGIAAATAGMKSFIVLNKVDLREAAAAARARLAPFERAGQHVVDLAAKSDAAPILPLLGAETTVLVGQSGMGKSTLINALVPGADAATNEISRFLASGRHTTTAARLYQLAPGTAIIDTPGMKEFGLAHLDRAAIDAALPDIGGLARQCRFNDCRHLSEPGCALLEALEAGTLDARRFELYQRIVQAEGLR
jgi:ribosome biogenesis GTPase / thiamine phosphate phosphatase